MEKPLAGYRILDLSNVLAGPFCCHQLVYLGAEVIKIEMPGRGDLARQLGSDPELNAKNMGISFLAQNAGKKSVTLNIKSEEGKTLFFALLKTADVLVENFRPGVMERLGLDYRRLREVRPNLVYCAISGFGQNGPLKNFPAYDQIIQGLSGAMSVTGESDGLPYRAGYPVADTVGGLTAAMAICSKLAEKNAKGGFIDVSMLESLMTTMGWVISNWLVGGTRPARFGNENTTSAPSGTFQTGGGLLNIAANKQEQYEALCHAIEKPELIKRREYLTREKRKLNRYRLRGEIEQALQTKNSEEWSEILNGVGVPAGRILGPEDSLDQEQLLYRRILAEFPAVPGVERNVRLMRTGFHLDGKPLQANSPPPKLGSHNHEIYGALGLSSETLNDYRERGVI